MLFTVAKYVPALKFGIATVALAACIASRASAAGMYDVPSPLLPAAPGSVIGQRPWVSGAAPQAAARNLLVLYHTRDSFGRDTAVSGTISIPRGTAPQSGWPVISWAHGTTGNAPQCAPSTFARPNLEQQLENDFVAHGYAVAASDYEGQATPGVHPYFVGVAGAHDVIDIVKAARSIEAGLGTRWMVMGHSEGGAVTIFAAHEAQSWAPQLTLVGAVAYAPGGNITNFLSNVLTQSQPTRVLPLLGLMIAGIGSSDPAIALDRLLTPQAQAIFPLLQQQCISALMDGSAWSTFPPKQLFRPGADLMPLARDFEKNEPAFVSVRVPLRIEQGTSDTIVPYETTVAMLEQLRARGGNPELDTVAGATHGTILTTTFNVVETWVNDRFAKADRRR